MSQLVVLSVLLPLAMSIAVTAVVLGFIRTATAGHDLKLPTHPSAALPFRAHVIRPDQQFSIARQIDSATYGTLTLTADELRWRPDSGAHWSAPVAAVTVTSVHGAMALIPPPSLDVFIDGAGPWRLVVSDRPINRFMRNTAKRFRQARTARLLAEALLVRGARSALSGHR